ncbi:unnamed protein product [Adineta steineri]|uniref:Uncharacterized protein n=1 Tax=Adineta steineri TaxID=433720 RepID=A0A815QBA5_9BILA|nr:unnamed protein product [Adineta steineri]CAF4076195.1 unnamed protein product [Adineta steineri]
MGSFFNLIVLIAFATIIGAAYARSANISHHNRLDQVPKIHIVSQSCITDYDCGEHGVCRDYVCECDEGYITWKDADICSYKQKTKLEAFLYSFFLGSAGVDWFILSRGNGAYITAGVFKIVSTFGCCVGIPFMLAGGIKGLSGCKIVGGILSCVFTFVAPIWYFVDWIRVLTDAFNDGNGAPLKPW